jgi:hypothetical protein
MKKQFTMNEEDFLQQFPHQSLFEESVEEIPDTVEMDDIAMQNLKPFNFADLHKVSQQSGT